MQSDSVRRGWPTNAACYVSVVCSECSKVFYVSPAMWKARCPFCGAVIGLIGLRGKENRITLDLRV